ncbi:hypothetical protein DPX16_13365 [Anabarilius grahami]|uniref:Uncharacterized protein n=1 Tax=Anabarilius grahami TaxID=495550 RepID=A0A3N0YNY2_ANAGA|nr:hypothetical protein DPX16_13365 [Anabarilius grahami]
MGIFLVPISPVPPSEDVSAVDRLRDLWQDGRLLERYVEEFSELSWLLNWPDALLNACFLMGLDEDTIRYSEPAGFFSLVESINLILFLNGSDFEIEEVQEKTCLPRPVPSEKHAAWSVHPQPVSSTYPSSGSSHSVLPVPKPKRPMKMVPEPLNKVATAKHKPPKKTAAAAPEPLKKMAAAATKPKPPTKMAAAKLKQPQVMAAAAPEPLNKVATAKHKPPKKMAAVTPVPQGKMADVAPGPQSLMAASKPKPSPEEDQWLIDFWSGEHVGRAPEPPWQPTAPDPLWYPTAPDPPWSPTAHDSASSLQQPPIVTTVQWAAFLTDFSLRMYTVVLREMSINIKFSWQKITCTFSI